MVAAKERTKTDPKDSKTLSFVVHLSKLEKVKNFSQQPAGPSNHTHNPARVRPNSIGRHPKKSYLEGLYNLESWSF